MKTAKTIYVLAGLLLPVSIPSQEAHHDHSKMHHDDVGHTNNAHGMRKGFYGPYSMSREASGTSWQPEAVSMGGMHFMKGDWMLMLHGFADVAYDHQGGKRGDDDWFSANMVMLMGNRPAGAGTFGFRTMFSLEPATIGKTGYAELLQTGETANGRTHLIDRQHPHDLFMELAVTYNIPVRESGSVFAYFGLPGEPALGPPTFMHRFSGVDNPEAPLAHHWLDSTHIAFGVATLGYVWNQFKIDGSLFTGREPDEFRWDIERPRFDSQAVRLSYNPTEEWAFQVSYGHINSPEQLEPGMDVDRITASVSYHKAWHSNQWQTTFAWGQNRNEPGRSLDAFLVESAINFHDRHTVFSRAERVSKDELFEHDHPLEGKKFTIHKLSLGYIYDFARLHHVKFGVGGVGSVHFIPTRLERFYGDTPRSFLLFVRAKL